MKNKFDRLDLYAALGLFATVAAWAFLWAHPYPHPNLWPFLVAVREKVSYAALGVAGRLAIGAFAAFTYLVLRGFWFLHRDSNDDLPDDFAYTRTAPICGAAVFAMIPCAWRAGQFLSPGFAGLVLVFFGLFLWFVGRGGNGLLSYSFAYLVIGFVSGYNLLALTALGFVTVSDAILRWQDGLAHDQREDDEFARRKKAIETSFSVVSGTVGFVLGAGLLFLLSTEHEPVRGIVERIVLWWTVWTGDAIRAIFRLEMLALVLSPLVAAVALAIGRRIRSLGPYGLMMCRVLSGLLAVVTMVMFFRSVDRAERVRLQAIREYATLVMDDARSARYLFTDGRFDDILRLEFASRGIRTAILNTMSVPSPQEALRLKLLAPESGERAIFEVGGAEVFKAWARERPDRLAESAWQLGDGLVRRHGKTKSRTSGSVMRVEVAAQAAADAAADRRFAAWSQGLVAIAERYPAHGSMLGGVDEALTARFDALLWRAARLANERAERLLAAKATTAAEDERQSMRRLDALNASLRAQGEIIEQIMPTEKFVFTTREALDVAVRRADFTLARRYATDVLASAPDDQTANFALGMANMEAKEYFRASVCFEKVLRKNPKEPAALNNLAIAYVKLGQVEKALDRATRAAQIYPKSVQVQQTLAEIRKHLPKETP